jgi:hypothetical protein
MEMQARHGYFGARLAETQFDTTLVRLNCVNALNKPENGNNRRNDKKGAAIETAGNEPPQPVLTTANNVFKVGWPAAAASTRPVRSLPPWPLIISTASATAAPRAAAAILIAPGHQNLFVSELPVIALNFVIRSAKLTSCGDCPRYRYRHTCFQRNFRKLGGFIGK